MWPERVPGEVVLRTRVAVGNHHIVPCNRHRTVGTAHRRSVGSNLHWGRDEHELSADDKDVTNLWSTSQDGVYPASQRTAMGTPHAKTKPQTSAILR